LFSCKTDGGHAQNFLAHSKGTLMVDGFGGYKALFAQGITELGCLAHARRKFFDLNGAQANAIAQEALARIAALYAIEAQGREGNLSHREIARAISASPTTVGGILRRAKLTGLIWPLPAAASEAALEAQLYPPTAPSSQARPAGTRLTGRAPRAAAQRCHPQPATGPWAHGPWPARMRSRCCS
jgi:hypothetical protein